MPGGRYQPGFGGCHRMPHDHHLALRTFERIERWLSPLLVRQPGPVEWQVGSNDLVPSRTQ